MKRLILAGLVSLGAFFAVQASVPEAQAGPKSCANVRCMACPEGSHWAPIPGNCCRCLPN